MDDIDIINSLDNETKNYINNFLSKDELNDIINAAKQDCDKLDDDDIDNLIDAVEIPENHYLENSTTESILNDICSVIKEYNYSEKFVEKLTKYRYVDEISEIFKGRNIKYINKNNSKLINGGIVLDVKFLKNGTHILCKGHNYINQIKFDNSIIFQMLTTEEELVLMTNSYIHK